MPQVTVLASPPGDTSKPHRLAAALVLEHMVGLDVHAAATWGDTAHVKHSTMGEDAAIGNGAPA